jgi:hypothetical protein
MAHTLHDHNAHFQTPASFKTRNKANIHTYTNSLIKAMFSRRKLPPFPKSAPHQKTITMCILTPYQFTCADPFGDHICGNGYYFHDRAVCHHKPACTKFYTAPIMLETSCGTCEQDIGYVRGCAKTSVGCSPNRSASKSSATLAQTVAAQPIRTTSL